MTNIYIIFFLQIVLWFKLWHLYDTINTFFRYDFIHYTYFKYFVIYVQKLFSFFEISCLLWTFQCLLLDHFWLNTSYSFYFYSKTNKIHQVLKFISCCSTTLHVSESLSVHHQECKTVHTASGSCQKDYSDCLLSGTRWNISSPLASSQQNLFYINQMLYVQSYAPDDGRKDSPKHVECCYKIK
jgi:hypothetical protein